MVFIPVSRVHIGFLSQWHIIMLELKKYTGIVFQGIWVYGYCPYFIEKLAWRPTSRENPWRQLLGNRSPVCVFEFTTLSGVSRPVHLGGNKRALI